MRIGRPLSYDPDKALGAATAVFWAQGFEASSLQDLLVATGLSKSSLYQKFGSKQVLFEHCLEQYSDQVEKLLRQLLLHAPGGREFIQMVLTQIISEEPPAKGCLIFNTASELGQLEPEVTRRVDAGISRFRSVFHEALLQDQQAGRLTAEADTEALSEYLMTAIGGLRSMVKVGRPAASLKASVAIIMRSLEYPPSSF